MKRRRLSRLSPDQFGPLLARLASAVIVLTACWLIAGLWAQAQGPQVRPPMNAPAPPEQLASEIANRHLLGSATAAAEAPPQSQAFRLLGVIAAGATGGGAAVVQAEGSNQSQVVRTGEPLADGVRLSRIDARSVTLDQHGRQITLTLPEKSTGMIGTLPTQPQVFKD